MSNLRFEQTFRREIVSFLWSLFSDVKEVTELVIWTNTVFGVSILAMFEREKYEGKLNYSTAIIKNRRFVRVSWRLLKLIAGSRLPITNDWSKVSTWLESKYGGKLRGRLLNVILLVVFSSEKTRMRINCEISIVNRIAASHNVRNASKPARASLAIGRKDSSKLDDERGKNVFLLVCTAKERNGAKYKVCGVRGCQI